MYAWIFLYMSSLMETGPGPGNPRLWSSINITLIFDIGFSRIVLKLWILALARVPGRVPVWMVNSAIIMSHTKHNSSRWDVFTITLDDLKVSTSCVVR